MEWELEFAPFSDYKQLRALYDKSKELMQEQYEEVTEEEMQQIAELN